MYKGLYECVRSITYIINVMVCAQKVMVRAHKVMVSAQKVMVCAQRCAKRACGRGFAEGFGE